VPVLVSLLARAGSRPKIAPRADIRHGTQAAHNCPSLLNLQQNESSVIGSRLVLQFGGHDSVSPMNTYLRFVRELQRFRETWSVTNSASAPSVAADRAEWRIVSNGPNWWWKPIINRFGGTTLWLFMLIGPCRRAFRVRSACHRLRPQALEPLHRLLPLPSRPCCN
jgi:hypothetical protein